jgi:signal transduction histidine kinase
VHSLAFPQAGLILLQDRERDILQAQAAVGFTGDLATPESAYHLALDLGERCVAAGVAMCRHRDGQVIRFSLADLMDQQRCRHYDSPVSSLGLPLTVQQRVIGSLVLARPAPAENGLSVDEFTLITAIAQQLGLSIEDALLYQEAHKREMRLAELLHQVVTVQESERKRMARELHDATGQSLTAITLGLRGIETRLADERPDLAGQIRELKSFGVNALGELRQLISDLRPPQLDDLGLVDALHWYLQTFEKRHTIRTDFVISGEPLRLPAEYETVLFRIAQEALTNVAKHAAASHVVVKLDLRPAQMQLTIEDDGCGFDPAAVLAGEGEVAAWGLLGIGERTLLLGGQYEVNSQPGCGTCIRVNIPLGRIENVEDKALVS